jgi:HD-GYP domain-containing protein (c-di-GMP phosphodiesterase class II)
MTKKSRFTGFVFIFLFMSTVLLFADNVLIERYLTAANKEYTAKNYSKAFSYINYVLGEYSTDNLPQNVEMLAEYIYFSYLTEIKDTANYDAFRVVKEKLLEFPVLSTERISRLVKTINTLEAQDISWGQDKNKIAAESSAIPVPASSLPVPEETQLSATVVEQAAQAEQTATQSSEQAVTQSGTVSSEGQNTLTNTAPAAVSGITADELRAQIADQLQKLQFQQISATQDEVLRQTQSLSESIKQQNELSEKEKAELQKKLDQAKAEYDEALQTEYERQQQVLEAQKEAYETAITQTSQQSQETRAVIRMLVIGAGAVLLVIALIVGIGVSFNVKNNRKQQEQFEATLQLVAQMNRSQKEQMRLPGVYDSRLRSAGSTSLSNALPEPELTEEEQTEVNELASKCEKMGAEIDRVTGRKNNSKNVSEMVYKICSQLGVSPNTTMIYFCAAMVYDAGFLLVDPKILQGENLTDEDKYIIRSHVQKGVDQIDFVPERYKSIFLDAILKHHENINGSGYPAGLSGDEIPVVARVIHVVETFISLISKRSYRNIFDKESAINELRAHPELYDISIIDILDSLV